MDVLYRSTLASLPLVGRGKVRENYAVGSDRLLMVASDRISAFDVVMGEPIPGKGALLTRMALFWFDRLAHVVPNHLTGDAPESAVAGPRVHWMHGILVGSMIIVIRVANPAQPDGVVFAALLGALFAPLIDRALAWRPRHG